MVKKMHFGKMPDGREVSSYVIENERLSAVLTDLGAVLLSLSTPDKQGNKADVVLGHRRMEDYLTNPGCFGATVGPNANRIAGAAFTLGGREYRLAANNGRNNLHSGGYFYRSLFAAEPGEDSVTFSLAVGDMEDGFPGNREFHITYTLTEEELRIDYLCTTDAETIFNLTNHSYFNLKGAGSGDILSHVLQLNCSAFTPSDETSIPTGEIRAAKGTAFDFLAPAAIGERMDMKEEQIRMVKGYDHNFVIDGYTDGKSLLAAGKLTEPVSGRILEVYTTAPGIQIYTFNRDPYENGKDGKTYPCYGGIAMETQFFPDSIHQPLFPSPVFGPAREYRSTTVFRFPAL